MRMARALKIFIALVVAASLAAASSGTASAALFHSEVEPTTIQGTQTAAHIYKFGEVSFTCDFATLEGTQSSKTAEALVLSPSYPSNCDMVIGGTKFTVGTAINGCTWRLQADGTEKIECPAGKAMEFSYSGCLWKVGAQTLKTVSYANNGSRIDLSWNLSGIAYTYSGFVCGSGAATNGVYQGTSTAVGKNGEGKEVKIWWA
jgi:hypothetical protein